MKRFFFTFIAFCFMGSLWAQNTNLSQGNVFDGEPYLAINPNNSNHLVVAWMGWVNLANRFKIKTKTSLDGGQTWSTTIELPHVVSTFSSADPCVAFNHLGDIFISYIDFTGTAPPVTGGVYLCKSTDGGISWGAPTPVVTTSFDGTKWPIDRPWMVIDNSSSLSSGTIYITSMNLNRNNPPYNPYVSVSRDNGASFSTRYLDTTGWLAGSLNNLPICSPVVTSNGDFYGAYPSYVISQSFFVRSLLAKSTDEVNSLSHSVVYTVNPPANLNNYPDAKKAPVMVSNPANPSHLAYVFLANMHQEADVFMIETTNGGSFWSSPQKVNDDPIGNNRLQDLIWADFDVDGDLIVTWRDRRNGTDSTFQTASEIYAAFRSKDSTNFEPNFQVTDRLVTYDSVLTRSGNDFMCVKLLNDTIHATWGDARSGKLNIWYQRTTTKGNLVSLQNISSEEIPEVLVYPNPTTDWIYLKADEIKGYAIFSTNGKLLKQKSFKSLVKKTSVSVREFPAGTYLIHVRTARGTYTKKIIKK